MTHWPWAVAAAAGLLTVANAGDSAVAVGVRDLVYFGPAGPVRLQFRMSIDSRPVDAAWSDAVEVLFKQCDRNSDGVLDTAERAVFAPPRRRRNADVVDGTTPPPVELKFGRDEEAVTRVSFTAAVRTAGFGPARLAFSAARPDSPHLSSALFQHLDRDGDGTLSNDELRVVRDRLAPLDGNEDEFVSAAELLGRADPATTGRPNLLINSGASTEDATASSPDLMLVDSADVDAVQQIIASRGSGRATGLSREEVGTNAETFATLDKDRNGRVDASELTDWLRQPADASFAVEFDPTGELRRLSRLPGTTATELVTLAGTLFRFERSGADGTRPRAVWEQASTGLGERFRQLARPPATIERTALAGQPALLRLLSVADRKGAGHLVASDIDAALKALVPLACCRVEIAVADQGNGLFELLDRNGDGQLSLRELTESAVILRPFADAGGAIAPKALPRRFTVRTSVASLPLVVVPMSVAPSTPIPPARPPRRSRVVSEDGPQ